MHDDEWLVSVDRYGSGTTALFETRLPEVHRHLRAHLDTQVGSPAIRAHLVAQLARHAHSGSWALAVAGARGVDERRARPVAAASALWAVGAQLLDNAMDTDFSLPPEVVQKHVQLPALAGATALGPLMTTCLLEAPTVASSVRLEWLADMARYSLVAASGQSDDVADDPRTVTPTDVLARYRAKTGSAYARDATMIGRLVGGDLDGDACDERWNELATTVGVLAQLRNDRAEFADGADHHGDDLDNHTASLLAACAWAAGKDGHPGDPGDPRDMAPRSRGELRAWYLGDGARGLYARHVAGQHRRAADLLDDLHPPDPYRRAIRIDIDLAAQMALDLPSP